VSRVCATGSELLLRVLFDPEHILNGEIIETSISLDDLKSNGYSVDRKGYINLELFREKVAAQVRRKPEKRESSFSSELGCKNIREFNDDIDGERDFLVVDEIDEEESPINPAHAAIYSANKTGKGGLRKIRRKLVVELNKTIIPHADLLQELSSSRNSTDNPFSKSKHIKNKPFLILAAILLLLLSVYAFYAL
jgi:hypothetical protein